MNAPLNAPGPTHATLEQRDTLPVSLIAPAPSRRSDLRYDLAGHSDIGCRRERNEDSFLVAALARRPAITARVRQRGGASGTAPPSGSVASGAPVGALLAVADGLGGHGGGEIASAAAVASLERALGEGASWLELPRSAAILDALHGVVQQCQDEVERAAGRANMAHMEPGTTLTLACIVDGVLHLAHAGDSRCYLLRDGAMVQLTRDHTLAEQMTAASGMRPTQARFDHILFNVLGGGRPDLFVDTQAVQLQPGDEILLCSDGLTKHLSDADITTFLQRPGRAAALCHALVAEARARGGRDNITTVLCRVA